jgi:hypothetical protein
MFLSNLFKGHFIQGSTALFYPSHSHSVLWEKVQACIALSVSALWSQAILPQCCQWYSDRWRDMADSMKDMAKEMESAQPMVGTYTPDVYNVLPLTL